MFSIESGVPIKGAQGKSGRSALYPFRDMDVGDSFFVPKRSAKKAQSAANVFSHRNKEISLKTRTQPCGGIRIWRVA